MAANVFSTPFSFNETGEYLCNLGNDGRLKLWDTSTGSLKQEYTKNLHLSSPCTCVAWLHASKYDGSAKKPRLSTGLQVIKDAQDVVAIGTSSGSIMLYAVSNKKILSEILVHNSKINCLSVSKFGLYSCGDDKFIAELDLTKHKVKRKWKAGKEGVKSILALSCGKKLLSASSKIKLWDLKSQEILQTFVGHGSEVFKLLEVPERESYFVSAAKGDRVINAWSFQEDEKTTNSVASFILPDSAASVHLINNDNSSTLCALSESGSLHIFQHKLNGPTGKPLKPKINITIAKDDNDRRSHSAPLPIQAAFAVDANRILIAYGNPAILLFENLLLSEHQDENVVLLRDSKLIAGVDEFNSRNRVPNTDGDVEYLGVGTPRSRGKGRDVPLERRLDNLALASPSTNHTIKKDNLAQLLLQGLQSKNRDLINEVLFRPDESIVVPTVRSLPIQSLHPLIKELTTLMQGKSFTSRTAVRWLTAILRTHAAILLSNPDLAELVEPLLITIEDKVANFSGLLRLRGRLSLVSEQIGGGAETTTEEAAEPLINYQDQDDESDSEQGSSVDSADEWNEFSGVEDSDKE